jgi:DNA-binding MarR family transcriptional regulator
MEQCMKMYEICLLHARSDRAMRALIAERLNGHDVTMMEWLLLGVVSRGKSSGLTMSEIANTLQVTLPQVTALVNKLLPLKLIKQKSANNDRRSRVVTVTSKGQLALEDANKALDTAMNQLLGTVPKEQLQVYLSTLERIISAA